ncbi:MAG: hypothetical protein H0V70_05840 [Ktedonobacteraceae bacterium]|nr:hypothetical protein [Ktedonobacteraceae bacterium]
MDDWKDIKIEGVSRIERVALRSQAIVIGRFPGPSVAVNILEEDTGTYRGMTNMAARDIETREPFWIEGRGKTVMETLEQTILLFLESTHGRKLDHEDVDWKDSRRF